jgi:hypothetical protein
MMTCRLQIVSGEYLVAEVICPDSRYADKVFAAYQTNRIKNGKDSCGACINNLEVSRFWNVAVGIKLNKTN